MNADVSYYRILAQAVGKCEHAVTLAIYALQLTNPRLLAYVAQTIVVDEAISVAFPFRWISQVCFHEVLCPVSFMKMLHPTQICRERISSLGRRCYPLSPPYS